MSSLISLGRDMLEIGKAFEQTFDDIRGDRKISSPVPHGFGESPSDLLLWCGHWWVSRKTWQCPDCRCHFPGEAKARLTNTPTVAPPGYLWVLLSQTQPDFAPLDDLSRGFGSAELFTDRANIAKRMIRDGIFTAKELRECLSHVHWYQCVYNQDVFEGFEESEDSSLPQQYSLALQKIDQAG